MICYLTPFRLLYFLVFESFRVFFYIGIWEFYQIIFKLSLIDMQNENFCKKVLLISKTAKLHRLPHIVFTKICKDCNVSCVLFHLMHVATRPAKTALKSMAQIGKQKSEMPNYPCSFEPFSKSFRK